MSIAFPPSPTIGDVYEYNALEWVCTGVSPPVWTLNINAGQVGTGWQGMDSVVVVSPFQNSGLTSLAWLHKVYV